MTYELGGKSYMIYDILGEKKLKSQLVFIIVNMYGFKITQTCITVFIALASNLFLQYRLNGFWLSSCWSFVRKNDCSSQKIFNLTILVISGLAALRLDGI